MKSLIFAAFFAAVFAFSFNVSGYAQCTEDLNGDLRINITDYLQLVGKFGTNCPETVEDRDGNLYKYVVIGTQTWMASNLRVTQLNDGTPVPLAIANWNSGVPAYCWYNNDETANKFTYGALYNWYTVQTGNLCPSGWRVPTDADWTVLTDYLGGAGMAGGKLKETGTTHWLSPNTGATNETGFGALPGGMRDDAGDFSGLGTYGFYWSSTGPTFPYFRRLAYNGAEIYNYYEVHEDGMSVRCIKE